jgi:hypothetical protein
VPAVGRPGGRHRRTAGPAAAVGVVATGHGQAGPSRSVRRTGGPSPAWLSNAQVVTVAAQIAAAEAAWRPASGPEVVGPDDHPADAVVACRGRRAGAAARGRTTPRRPTRYQPAMSARVSVPSPTAYLLDMLPRDPSFDAQEILMLEHDQDGAGAARCHGHPVRQDEASPQRV